MRRHVFSFLKEDWELTAAVTIVITGCLLGAGLSERYGLEFSQAVPVFAPLLTVQVFVINFVIIGAIIVGGFALSIPSLFMAFTQSVGAGIAVHFVRAHLLFEVAALVLALAAAFTIATGEIHYFRKKRQLGPCIISFSHYFRKIIGRKVKIYIALVIIFLLVGALVECMGGVA